MRIDPFKIAVGVFGTAVVALFVVLALLSLHDGGSAKPTRAARPQAPVALNVASVTVGLAADTGMAHDSKCVRIDRYSAKCDIRTRDGSPFGQLDVLWEVTCPAGVRYFSRAKCVAVRSGSNG